MGETMPGRTRSFRRAKFLPATFLLMPDREWNHSRRDASDEIPKKRLQLRRPSGRWQKNWGPLFRGPMLFAGCLLSY